MVLLYKIKNSFQDEILFGDFNVNIKNGDGILREVEIEANYYNEELTTFYLEDEEGTMLGTCDIDHEGCRITNINLSILDGIQKTLVVYGDISNTATPGDTFYLRIDNMYAEGIEGNVTDTSGDEAELPIITITATKNKISK